MDPILAGICIELQRLADKCAADERYCQRIVDNWSGRAPERNKAVYEGRIVQLKTMRLSLLNRATRLRNGTGARR